MIRRLSAFLFTFFLLVAFAMPIAAETAEETAETVKTTLEGILHQRLSVSDVAEVQAWIDGPLADKAGISSEWYVLALRQYGSYDFSRYEAALSSYLESHEVFSASSRQKYALALMACGSPSRYVSDTLNQTLGKQGVMSWIYGLHLVNNGCVCDDMTADAIVAQLLALQVEDGGWAVSGQTGNVDVTAMAIQALSPYYTVNSDVTKAIDQAVTLLSSRQLPDGDYALYGTSNPESTAQVWIALSSLGINGIIDERFIQNGNTLLDGIQKYRLADGSFCHKAGGETSETATVQVLMAMIAYWRMGNGQPSFYMFDPISVDPVSTELRPSDRSTSEASSALHSEPSWNLDKRGVCLVLVLIGVGGYIVLFIMGKRHIKNAVAIGIAVALAVVLVCVIDIQSPEEYYRGEAVTKEHVIGTVTLSIRCDTLVGMVDSPYIPEDGTILDTCVFSIAEGDTVYDILIEAARQYQIHVENNGTSEMAYIAGIQYLYESDYGDLSGWVFHVNGVSPSVGCGAYVLSDGDIIEWHYTCDLGQDVS